LNVSDAEGERAARCQVGEGLPVIGADRDVHFQAAGRGDKSLSTIRISRKE
jgi:hypothetical protein